MNQEQKQEAIQVMEVAAKLSGDALALRPRTAGE